MDDLRIKLLKRQREKGLTGFTMAYLIGALREPVGAISGDEGRDYREFVELLEHFQNLDHISKCYIGIAECVKLKQPVAALYNSSEALEERKLEIIKSNSKNSTLYASSQYHKKGSFDSLVEALWQNSKQHILAGEFSFENSQYSAFTNKDKANIAEAKNA